MTTTKHTEPAPHTAAPVPTAATTTTTTWQQIDPTWHRTNDPERWASVWMDADHRWHWSVLTPDGQQAGGVVETLASAKAEATRALADEAKKVAQGC